MSTSVNRPPFVKRDEKTGIFHSTLTTPEALPDHLDVWTLLISHQPKDRKPPAGQTWFIDAYGSHREIKYEEVVEKVETLATAFRDKLGLKKGDVIGVCAPNAIYWAYVLFAAWRCGAAVAPVNHAYQADELAHHLRICQKQFKLKAIVGHSTSKAAVEGAAKDLGVKADALVFTDSTVGEWLDKYASAKKLPQEKWGKGEAKKRVALINASSGTTGRPKAIGLSHYNVLSNFLLVQHYLASINQHPHLKLDRALGILPFSHIFGVESLLLRNLYGGKTLVPLEKFELKVMLELIQELKITRVEIVPPMVLLLAKHPLVKNYDLSSLLEVTSGAAPLGSDLAQAFVARVPSAAIGNGYGATEMSCTAAAPAWHIKDRPTASCGILIPGMKAKVVDPASGKLLGFGQRGELVLQGPGSSAFGYLANEKETKETFITDRSGIWTKTGDEGYLDEQGFLYITDRLKEFIKVKGSQVAPSELEDSLLSLDEVNDCCVVGVPDDYAGELPRAYVVLSEAAKNADQQQLTKKIYDHVANTKARHKKLDGGIIYLDAIPKTPSGKLLRRELRDRAKKEAAEQKGKGGKAKL